MERPDFIPFFRVVIDHPDCTNLDAVLYGYIYWLTKLKNEKCTASNETLAQLCKSTATSVQNSLTTLEKAGFILRKFKDNNPRESRLEIIPLLSFGKVSPTGDRGYHPQVIDLSPTGDQNKSIELEHIGEGSYEPRVVVEVKENTDTQPKRDRVIPSPFSVERTRSAWQDGERRLQVLDWYFSESGLWSKAVNPARLRQMMARYNNAAKRIAEADWTPADLRQAKSKILQNDTLQSEWTLETVEKYLMK